jgi:hypothetical protein
MRVVLDTNILVSRDPLRQRPGDHRRRRRGPVLRLNSIHPTWRLSETLGGQRVVDGTALPAWRRFAGQLAAAILGDPTRWRQESVGRRRGGGDGEGEGTR